MRKSGDWMSIWDDRILEYILENGSGSPTEIANSDYVHISKQHTSRRLRTLADHGLLNSLGNGIYQINKKGRHYLIGNFDAEEHDYIDPEAADMDVRTSQYDSGHFSRVVEINLNPANEDDAIEQLQGYHDNLNSLLNPVLLQIHEDYDEKEITEQDVEEILIGGTD